MIWTLRCALLGVLSVAPISIACAQLNPSVTVYVKYYPDRAPTPYDFGVRLLAFNESVTIKAPDGTLFETPPDSNFNWHDFEDLTATDLNRYLGLWTINDSQGLPSGSAPQQHTFSVSRSDLTNHPPLPYVISPTDGSVVPPVFEVKTSHGGFSLRGIGGSGRIESLATPPVGGGPLRYRFDPGVTEAVLALRAANQDVDIRTAAAPPRANRRFSVWKVNDIYSAPSTFTVAIPEPTTLTIGCLAILSLAALRRRK